MGRSYYDENVHSGIEISNASEMIGRIIPPHPTSSLASVADDIFLSADW